MNFAVLGVGVEHKPNRGTLTSAPTAAPRQSCTGSCRRPAWQQGIAPPTHSAVTPCAPTPSTPNACACRRLVWSLSEVCQPHYLLVPRAWRCSVWYELGLVGHVQQAQVCSLRLLWGQHESGESRNSADWVCFATTSPTVAYKTSHGNHCIRWPLLGGRC
eukprot:GHUV01048081.1.p1 GENE.GHUV01048081.1~~GHUV01048081.1.p1  ORF type:complete len:160 (-),score=18.04 GHUV01048081.1:59-538(-)